MATFIQEFQGLFWYQFLARLGPSGGEEAQLPLSAHAVTDLGASGLAQSHRAAAEEVGKQSLDCACQLPAPACGTVLQRVQLARRTTAAPLRLCVVEKIGLYTFRNLTKQRHQVERTPAVLRGPLRGWAQCGPLSPWVAAKLGLATMHYWLWAVTMLHSAGEAQGQVR